MSNGRDLTYLYLSDWTGQLLGTEWSITLGCGSCQSFEPGQPESLDRVSHYTPHSPMYQSGVCSWKMNEESAGSFIHSFIYSVMK